MNAKHANQVLMVESDATFDDVRYAYRKLALELHPDKNNKEKNGEKFNIVGSKEIDNLELAKTIAKNSRAKVFLIKNEYFNKNNVFYNFIYSFFN